MSDINWEEIRASYESGMSLRQLSAMYHVSKSVIGDRKYREQWQERTKTRTEQQTSESKTHNLNAAVQAQMAIKIFLEERPPWDEIAQRAGYASRGAAYNAVKRELDRRVTHDIHELRTQELYRIEQLQARCYSEAMNKDNKYFTYAMEQFGKLSKRKSEIMGIDKTLEEEMLHQNYEKRIVLTHSEDEHASSHD